MDITDPTVIKVIAKHALLMGMLAVSFTVTRDLFRIALYNADESRKQSQ